MVGEINKDELTKKMSDNLVVLRAMLRLKQSELAEKVGISRQTLLEIEKGKRALQWNVFVALLSVFREDNGTNDLLLHYGIYTPELGRYLVSPESCGNK
ncbi:MULTISPECIES: helix-turn-helix transcriptional regulator [unclassified Pyramidobacter]|uniref:helix-turn-helix transcriptional regulator n=1 Tax=unclassified Pyramidobacter TaxID=2632171 RepID=UPI000EA37854|nr:helix-turn-helix domain-containing protein [Pyramidobacter sp. CG50-2]RKJ81169.1 helix-turn-helix domain-containing protein [Pyramidobacter sp. CG50-2]